MNKQEEIREVIDLHTSDECLYPDKDCASRGFSNYCRFGEDVYKCLMQRLTEIGVVIKVDCPECDGDGRIQKFFERTFSNRCPKCNGYGYVATEPLIKDN